MRKGTMRNKDQQPWGAFVWKKEFSWADSGILHSSEENLIFFFFPTRVLVVNRQCHQLILESYWGCLMSFLFGNGLAISGIEVGRVCLPPAKPFIPDTLYISRHGQANWLSGPPKNDVGETQCQRQRRLLCLWRKKSSPGCSVPEGGDSLRCVAVKFAEIPNSDCSFLPEKQGLLSFCSCEQNGSEFT